MCAAGFYIIPRSPTEVYYDVSTEAVEAQLYNWFYCCNFTSNANCPASAQAFNSLHPQTLNPKGNFRLVHDQHHHSVTFSNVAVFMMHM